MVTTVALSAQFEGVPVSLHNQSVPVHHDNPQVSEYLTKGKILASFLWHQALGIPRQDHSFYQQFKIEAVTLRGIHQSGHGMIDGYRIERTLECVIYSLNNLLERLHHAYWFYLLASPDLFIPLGIYIGPVIALSTSLIFYASV